jgi:hypothetical protein
MWITLPTMPNVYQPMPIDILVTKLPIAFKQRVLRFQLRLSDVLMI